MNSKMTTNSQLSTTEPKKTKTKTITNTNSNQEWNHRNEITWRVISREEERGEWGKSYRE